jgi:crossover junction endodeoxyribonuclease RusA
VSELLRFTVYGDPATKGNLRRSPNGGMYESNPRLALWRQKVAAAAGEAMGARPLYDEGLRLTLRYVLVRPAGHWTTKGELSAEGRRHPYPDRKPDLDKLTRAVLDALTHVVWRDDARVVQLEVGKSYGEPARVEAEVGPALPPRPCEGDVAERLDRLADAIGETSESVDPEEQLGTVLRLVDGQFECPCGATYEPLARSCVRCGRATFSQYAPVKRAALVPLEPDESLQRARSA